MTEDAQLRKYLKLTISNEEEEMEKLGTFPELFSNFIKKLGSNLEVCLNDIGAQKCQNLLLDCSDHLKVLVKNKD